MDKENITELSCYQKQSSYSFNKANQHDCDYEDWEADHELVSKEDYVGLVKYREEVVKNNPNDFYSKYYLGEAIS